MLRELILSTAMLFPSVDSGDPQRPCAEPITRCEYALASGLQHCHARLQKTQQALATVRMEEQGQGSEVHWIWPAVVGVAVGLLGGAAVGFSLAK